MIRSLYLRYVVNDLRRNRGVVTALMVVLVLSAFLMASGAMVLERLAGSVGRMFEVAKPPHFLQMHQGSYDTGALAAFADGRPEIEAWLIEEMLGFDGQSIAWERAVTGERGDLSVSMIDNLFVTQNDAFDFLLTGGDVVPRPAVGEVYVPVAYQQQFGLVAGDRLSVRAASGYQTFQVAGFVRDAQMASSMSSATRFLISDADFARLDAAGGGNPEIIVEYRLNDLAALDAFQRSYEADATLPKNGQAVTEVMIRLVNMFSDGLVAVAFVFASLLLIGIALLNVRFVIRGTLEDEVHEIGAMKAIGLPDRVITGLYLSRYGAMAFVACVVGGGLAVVAVGALTSGIRTNFSEAPLTVVSVLAPVAALAAVYLMVVGICAGVLRAVRRLEVVAALVHGSTETEKQAGRRARKPARGGRSSLRGAHGRRLDLRLAFLDLHAERGQWMLVPAVFFLTAVLITLPTNLLTTFESPRFVTYMGAPESDLRADVQFAGEGESADDVAAELVSRMDADPRLDGVRAYANVRYEAPGEEGWETLRVEVGDYDGSTLVFVDGVRPNPGEIALSVLNADKFGVRPGDALTVRRGGAESAVVVSGTYQDVTSGGFTAKMQGEVTSGADRWVVYADVADGGDPVAIAGEYDAGATAASVIPMRQYVEQTLSHATDAMRGAALLTLVFGLGSAALIMTLFLRLRLSKDRQKMGMLTAIGFSLREIVGQLQVKTVVTVVLGVVLGTVVAATLGEALVGAVISGVGVGIARLAFIPNAWVVYVAYPLLLIAAGTLGVGVLAARLRGADRSQWLR